MVTPLELTSGVDALDLSARGDVPAALLVDLDAAKTQALHDRDPLDADLGGYDVVCSVRAGTSTGIASSTNSSIGIRPSESLLSVRIRLSARALRLLACCTAPRR